MKYLVLLLVAISVSSCVKDKLAQDTLILEGTWRWDHSVEYTYDAVNDTVLTTVIPASDYADTYGIRILEKGKLYSVKNDTDVEDYRMVIPYFKSGLCNLNNSYSYQIHLNNDADNVLSGCVNDDTLTTSDLHLPLSKGSADYPYYEHYFVK